MADESGASGATPSSPDPAESATPSGQHDTGNGATPAGSSKEGATPDTSLGEAGQAALDKERNARRDAERSAAEYRRKLAELEDAGKPELERAQGALRREQAQNEAHTTRIAELETEIARRDLDSLRSQVAGEFGLPPKMADRLHGDDLRTLRADAKTLKEELGSTTPVGTFRGGEGSSAAGSRREPSMTDLIREAAGRTS